MNSTDISHLASKLLNDVQSSIEKEVLKICEKALKDAIMETVYSGSPGTYTRTMEFLRAVRVDKVSVGRTQATFEIIVDATMMGMKPPSGGKWGSHTSFSGQDVREELVGWLNDGTSNKYHSHPAHKFFDRAEDGLDNKIVKAMASSLSANGWEVTYI